MRIETTRHRPVRRKGKAARTRAAQQRQINSYLKAGWKIETEPPRRLCTPNNSVVLSKDKGWRVLYVTIH